MGRPKKVSPVVVEMPVNAKEVEVGVVIVTPTVEATIERPSKLNRSGRPKRASINGLRDKLTVRGQEEGWHYCWVNEDNVDFYQECLYEFVTHAVTVGEKQIAAATQVGSRISIKKGATVSYLMRVLDEYHQEDMEELHRHVDETEMSMRSELNSKSDGRYGEVKIEQSKPLSSPARRSFYR